MGLIDNIQENFDKNGIQYFKKCNLGNMMIVPYRGIEDGSMSINIYIDINIDLDKINFYFIEKRNKKNSINKIRSELLDINSSLEFGSFAMQNDSDSIEYHVDYMINNENDFSFEQYNYFVIRCIRAYELLKDKELI